MANFSDVLFRGFTITDVLFTRNVDVEMVNMLAHVFLTHPIDIGL